mgnify:FL=1
MWVKTQLLNDSEIKKLNTKSRILQTLQLKSRERLRGKYLQFCKTRVAQVTGSILFGSLYINSSIQFTYFAASRNQLVENIPYNTIRKTYAKKKQKRF